VKTKTEASTSAETSSVSGKPRWYELRPFFEPVDGKYADMHEVTKRLGEFSFFVVRSAEGMIRLFLHVHDASDAEVVQGSLKNALMESAEPKVFSASAVAYLRMKKHYAIPIAHELTQPLLYASMDKIGKPCFVAVTSKHSDESYQISQFVERNAYDKPPLWHDILDMFLSGNSPENPKRRISPQKLMLAELAKEKQRLRHFHCMIAIGASDLGTTRSIMRALSDCDGFDIASVKRDSTLRGRLKKPMLFASHFCVLSDIELANIIALPSDPRIHRFNISRKETYTSGPSQDIGGD